MEKGDNRSIEKRKEMKVEVESVTKVFGTGKREESVVALEDVYFQCRRRNLFASWDRVAVARQL